MKLGVEIIDACDLMPKDGQGSANPYVEIDFDDQRRRTHTKLRDLNPAWHETLLFDLPDPSLLPNQTITITVYHDRTTNPVSAAAAASRNFLGRVRISGASVAPDLSSAAVQRFPLEKRGIFSHIRGDIVLRLYAVPDNSTAAATADDVPVVGRPEGSHTGGDVEKVVEKSMKEDVEKKATRVSYSVGGGGGVGIVKRPQPTTVVVVEGNHARAEPPTPQGVVVQAPGSMVRQQPEYGLVETSPTVAGRLGYRSGDKVARTYDLVEQMHFLYVNVVKACDLPAVDLTGSLDPYVEVKLGNYKGTTKHLEKTQNPVWHQVFAFSRDLLQANLVHVAVKDHNSLLKDHVVGHVAVDLTDVPVRVPPDSPLAPQWYRLLDPNGETINKGEIMLAVWMGTQADEAFPEAWHSDAYSIGPHVSLAETHAQVYFSPKLCYLRVHVIEAQDLVTPGRSNQTSSAAVRVQVGHQLRRTRPARSVNSAWNEEFMFVAADPFDELLVLTVDDGAEPIGRAVIPLSTVPRRGYNGKPVESRWFNLSNHADNVDEDKKSESKFSSKIHLRLCLDDGYHVLDETTHNSSDLRPTSKNLRMPMIGILEVGILTARNLTLMMNPYCVAKYGTKWVRTRTLVNTVAPRWNEQYTWEVFDPCTVISVAVFDNAHVSEEDAGAHVRDQRVGKIRIRLSTLEVDRVYTHYYPLLVLQPSGLKKTGELQLAVRFTCTGWVNMLTLYGKPLLPKMHYVQPISVFQVDYLRHQAVQIVAARLARSEPPLRREVVEYMLDTDSHIWSLRKSKANFFRVVSFLSGAAAVGRWFDNVCNWNNPVTTVLVHLLFLLLVFYPDLILPTMFLYLFVIGVWNYRYRPRQPPHMDTKLSHAEWAQPDELDEEFDTFPTSRPPEVVRMRYDRMRSVAGRVQTVVGDLATQGERAAALLSWRDPRATGIFILFAVVCAVVLYVMPFQAVAVAAGLYLLRHPKFRTKLPSAPFNFYRRLPAKSDMLL